MQNDQLLEALSNLETSQKRKASLKAFIKEQLLNSPDYNKITGEIDKLNSSKKKIIAEVNSHNEQELNEIDNLSLEIKKIQQQISDLSLVAIAKGEKVNAKDKSGMILAPVISVKFKKTGDFEKPTDNN